VGAGAYALNPALDVSQYAHTAWKIREGFTKGAIYAIAQTPDSYLWLSTEFGLLRFDGGQGRSGAGASGPESSFEHCESRSLSTTPESLKLSV
jgi:ligand-binding sensor domain-containing protein